MTNEELIQEMKEQALEDLLLGYRDHHTYDDAATTPVEIDYTTQSWIYPYKKSTTFSLHYKQCLIMTSLEHEKQSLLV